MVTSSCSLKNYSTFETNENDTQYLRFYLKHLNVRTIRKLLDKTDWDSFTEYEIKNRCNDVFDLTIVDGVLRNERPDVDERRFYVAELSLHHLSKSFQKYLLKNYLVTDSLIEYETNYADSNNLYVVVEFNDDLYTEENENEKPSDEVNEEVVQQTNTILNYFDYESDQSESFLTPLDKDNNKVVNQYLPFEGFEFKINPKTRKSYVLYRPKTFQVVDSSFTNFHSDVKRVLYGDGASYPREWNVIDNYRPLFFKDKHNGWIVGLNQKDELVKLGAMNVASL